MPMHSLYQFTLLAVLFQNKKCLVWPNNLEERQFRICLYFSILYSERSGDRDRKGVRRRRMKAKPEQYSILDSSPQVDKNPENIK
jgi:hypothetical protein